MKIELLKSAFVLFLLTMGIVACSSEANIVPLYTATFYGYDDNGENAVVIISTAPDSSPVRPGMAIKFPVSNLPHQDFAPDVTISFKVTKMQKLGIQNTDKLYIHYFCEVIPAE